MNKIIHHLGLDVHKESIAVSIAPQGTSEVRRHGIINGSLDAVDKLVKKLANDRTDRRGRPVASELETDAARPRSVQWSGSANYLPQTNENGLVILLDQYVPLVKEKLNPPHIQES